MGRQDSWKKQAANRRDERSAKTEDRPGSGPSRHKDTKRWCKGKVGREHTLKAMNYGEFKARGLGDSIFRRIYQSWQMLVCTACGKQLEVYYGNKKQKPDWDK